MVQLASEKEELIAKSLELLKALQHETGLFSASHKKVKTNYHLAWIRDNIYISLGLEAANDIESLKKVYHALLDVLLKHEYKMDYAIKEKPKHPHQYIHARYHPKTMDEINEHWGNKQNDAIGALLFKIGDLEEKGISILRNENDKRLLQKLVYYLESVGYWNDEDNGMWEENEEAHASSIGACVAGLIKISKFINVPKPLIRKGIIKLNELLPNESETKDVDLALLSLVYPYDIVNQSQKDAILKNIEKKLLRKRGVIRYVGDKYYNEKGEAEWTMGLSWLAIIYKNLSIKRKYDYYMKKAISVMNGNNELPELYFADSDKHNSNSPLGWSQSLFLVAILSNEQSHQ